MVFKATDRQTGRPVALKVLHSHLAEEPSYVRRFHREIIIARALGSEHTVRVLGSGQDGDLHYLVMEYIDGPTLRQLLRRDGTLSTEEALRVALHVAEALREAHARGVVHRDIKPQNIFVPPGGVKVGDFGIARADDIASFTMQTGYVGTVAYSSPEQVRGEDVGPESDIYSLGCVLYEMLAGKPPFAGSALAVMDAHLNRQPQPLRGVPAAVAGIVARCMAKNPADRFLAAEELCGEIQSVSLSDLGGPAEVEATQWATTGSPTLTWPQAGAGQAGGRRPPGGARETGAADGHRRRIWLWLAAGVVPPVFAIMGVAAVLLIGGSGGDDSGEPSYAAGNTSTPASASGSPTSAPPPRSAALPLAYVAEFDMEGNVWLMDPEEPGNLGEQITSGGGYAHPAWSPDRAKLAYVRLGESGAEIIIWDATTSRSSLELGPVRAFEGDEPALRGPLWLPDGKSLLYHQQLGGPQTSAIRRHELGSPASGDQTILSADRLATFPNASVFQFDLIPPGDEMVVQVCADVPKRGCGLYRAPVDTQAAASLEPLIPVVADKFYGLHAVSPDGASVAFQSYEDPAGQVAYVEILDLTTLERRRLVEAYPEGVQTQPFWPKMSWSPDGASIAYQTLQDGRQIIYVRGALDALGIPSKEVALGRHPAW